MSFREQMARIRLGKGSTPFKSVTKMKLKIWLDNEKTNNPTEKWAKYVDRNLAKEDTQMQRCSASFVSRELQIKTVRLPLQTY